MNFQPFTGQISKKDEIRPDVAATFSGPYTIMQLPKNFELWRFIDNSDSKRFGIYWIDIPSMKQIMEATHQSGSYSYGFKQNNIKNSLAILDRWSNVEWRLKIRLTEEVIAYRGEIRTQFEFKEVHDSGLRGTQVQKKSETRRAVLQQYVIPSFYDLPENNRFAQIEHFAHI